MKGECVALERCGPRGKKGWKDEREKVSSCFEEYAHIEHAFHLQGLFSLVFRFFPGTHSQRHVSFP